jgi:hypothetical protein
MLLNLNTNMMSITEPALRDDSECLCFETTVQLSGQASCDLKVDATVFLFVGVIDNSVDHTGRAASRFVYARQQVVCFARR